MKKPTIGVLLCGMLVLLTGADAQGEENITIGSVVMNYSGEWFTEALQGQRDAAEDLGVDCIIASSDNEISKESDNIAMFISRDADALVIAPLSAEGSASAIDSAFQDADIPVVVWNGTVNTQAACYIGTDPKELGGKTGEYAASYIQEHMPEGCRLAIIDNCSYEIAVERCEGFTDALSELTEQGTVTLADTREAEFRDESYEAAKEILKEHPDVQMIWCWNQTSLQGCTDAVAEAGRTDIVLMGTDMSTELAEEMLGDRVNLLAVTTQMPYEMGYQAVVNAVREVKGEETEEELLIPTRIYTKDRPEEIREYIDEHRELVD